MTTVIYTAFIFDDLDTDEAMEEVEMLIQRGMNGEDGFHKTITSDEPLTAEHVSTFNDLELDFPDGSYLETLSHRKGN